MKFSNQTDLFSRQSPISCYKLNMLSAYCFLILILSLIFNTMLLRVFHLYKRLRTSINVIIIVLTYLNLIGSIIEMPFVILSNYYCRLVFKTFTIIHIYVKLLAAKIIKIFLVNFESRM